MANLKFSNNLFLGKEELGHLRSSLEDDGYKAYIKHIVTSYGIGRALEDISFNSFKVIQGTDINNISIQPGFAFNLDLNVIENRSLSIDALQVPADGLPRFILLSSAESVIEEGTISLDVNGGIVGTGTLFTQVLRGLPNFASKISFPNSATNTAEYTVANVTSDTVAQLNVPNNVITAETNVEYRIVGTFTPGKVIPTEDKFPLVKNSFSVTISDTDISDELNTFRLASVINDGVVLSIIDQRSTNIFTVGSGQTSSGGGGALTLTPNNLIAGIEQITYSGENSPLNTNLVKVGWGLKVTSSNWSFNNISQQITITAGSGGIWDDISEFKEDDFNNWLVSVEDSGEVIRIISSVMSTPDNNIVLSLDFVSSIPDTSNITIIPIADEIEFLVRNSSKPVAEKTEVFPIAQAQAQFPVIADTESTLLWRHNSGPNSTPWRLINDGSYRDEESFDIDGVLTQPNRTQVNYTDGLFTPNLNPENHEAQKAERSKTNSFSATNSFSDQTTFTGNVKISRGLWLNPGGVSINGTQSDLDSFTAQTNLRFSASNEATITGLSGHEPGKLILVRNRTDSTSTLTLSNESSSSSAQNRFSFSNGENLIIPQGETAVLIYNSGGSRWELISTSFSIGNTDWSSLNVSTGQVQGRVGVNEIPATNVTLGRVHFKKNDRVGFINITMIAQFSQSVDRVTYRMPTTLTNIVDPDTGSNPGSIAGAAHDGDGFLLSGELGGTQRRINIRPISSGSNLGTSVEFQASFTFAVRA